MILAIILFSWNYFFYRNTIGSFIEYLSYSLLPFLTCFALYKFASDGKIQFNLTLLLFVVFYIVAIIRFYHEKEAMVLNSIDYGNNNFYMIVLPLPILFIIPNRILRFAVMVISALLCMISLKRSAMLCAILIPSILLWFELKNGIKSKIAVIGLLIIAAVAVFNLTDINELYDISNKQLERFEQISQDGGSGRSNIIENFFEKDFEDVMLLMGQGFMGYHNKYPNLVASHNDIIEIYYSYGIIGLLIFIAFAVVFIKTGIKAIKLKSQLSLSYAVAIVLFVLYTCLSGLFTFVNLSLTFFAFIGLSQAYSIVYNDKK